jgi:HlyD family secretion protein
MKHPLRSHVVARAKAYIIAHKITSSIFALVLIVSIYKAYSAFTSTSGETYYVTSAVAKGTLIVSITGSGQVSASNQMEIKSKVSGNVVAVPAVDGQAMKAGELMVQIDARDALKTVRDAEANLLSAQISLEKTRQPADALSKIQSENALTNAQQSKQSAESDLLKTYDGGFNTIANAFLDLPSVMTGLNTVVNGSTINPGQTNADAYYDMIKQYKPDADQIRNSAIAAYQIARIAYDQNLLDYKNTSRLSDHDTIDAMIRQTYDTTKQISDAVKSAKNFLDFVNDTLANVAQSRTIPATLTTHIGNLQNHTGTVNGHFSNLLSIKTTITSSKDAIVNADRTIAEKTEALAKLNAGADPLDIKSQELTVRQRENALTDAKENLSDYYIRAPFDGVAAKMSAKKGDDASSGSALVTFITKQQLAELSLNEVDVAKVHAGEKATLTFDAVSGLSITGTVAGVDSVGTVTQGVVTYAVKIAFDTQDDRVKPGMSVSAAIVIDAKPDVLIVPNSAVKSQGEAYYVQIFDSIPADASAQGFSSPVAPREQIVEIGLANDMDTEVISGLNEGEIVVTRTTSPSATTATTVPSLFGGGARTTGGATRVQVR